MTDVKTHKRSHDSNHLRTIVTSLVPTALFWLVVVVVFQFFDPDWPEFHSTWSRSLLVWFLASEYFLLKGWKIFIGMSAGDWLARTFIVVNAALVALLILVISNMLWPFWLQAYSSWVDALIDYVLIVVFLAGILMLALVPSPRITSSDPVKGDDHE